jgi:hypothetical protein
MKFLNPSSVIKNFISYSFSATLRLCVINNPRDQ